MTSPRFMNHKFSPASFWYLYSADEDLKAMVVEVNNTFDERRMYFLPSSMVQKDDLREDILRSTESKSSSPSGYFRYTWSKDFHVSPFNSRKGQYTLSASDPALTHKSTCPSPDKQRPFVDIKAGLLSSKGRPKMVVRLWSTTSPIDPATISIGRALAFLLSWWWVGLITCK